MANNDPDFLPPDESGEEAASTEMNEAGVSALAILNQSEHAAMVQTANLPRNKRNLTEFDKKLMNYATHSQPVAISMFYSLPRAGKQIIGASIRFAEVAVPCWKNCATAVRVIGDSRETVTAQGVYIDYEANVRISIESSRRITDKSGNRYNADMIVTTANAASSIAYRNVVLRGIPRALWTPAYEAAKLTAVGQAMSLAQRTLAAMEYLTKLGVTEWQIFNSVGVASTKDLEVEHIVTLKVLCEEIKRGEKSIEDVFGSPYDKEIDSLFAQLKINAVTQRSLRESHMGHAKDLLEHLRARLEPSTRTVNPKPKEEPSATADPASAPPKRGPGRPRKPETTTVQEPVEVAQEAVTNEAEPEPQDGEAPAADPTQSFNF